MRPSRARTLAHLQRMATLGTAVTACFACGKTHGNEESSGCAKNPLAKPDANLTSSGGTSGYAVVDPVPTPAFCPGVAAASKATAKLEKGDGGATVVVVTIDGPTTVPGFKFVNDAPAYPSNATIVSHVATDAKSTTKLALAQGATGASFSVKTMCNNGPGNLNANVMLATAPGKPPQSASVYLSEY